VERKSEEARANRSGSGFLQWTRTQRIRTAASLPFQVALVDTAERPSYQRIAAKALRLRELGLSDRVIAKRLGVTDKTVAKGIEWLTVASLDPGHPDDRRSPSL